MLAFILYIIAISLQVSGALQLLLSFVSTKRDNVIRHFAGKGLISRDNNTKKIEYDKTAFREEYKTAYLNKFSFFYIAAGYLLGVYGNLEKNSKTLAFVLIILVTTLILLISNTLISLYVKTSKKTNTEITNEDLERLHINPDAENISDDEIDRMINPLFKISSNKI